MDELLERHGEVTRAEALVGATLAGGGSVVAFLGPPGIGKTSLLGALVGAAQEGGAAILEARGAEFERGFAFAIARQLLAPAVAGLDAGEREAVLDGSAALGAAAIDLEGTGGTGDVSAESLFTGIHGLYWLAANLAERRPLVLVLDDAQWADAESLRWVAYLARRLEGLPILIALAAREAEPGTDWQTLESILADADARVIRPAPLSEAATETFVTERLGAEPHPLFARACRAATGGNPYLLGELSASLLDDGVSPGEAEAARVADLGPRTVARAVLERVARLDPPCAPLAKALAILGHDAELRIAASMVGLDASATEAASDALVAAGVTDRRRPTRFVHPLVRAAIHDDVLPAERGSLHARAARLLADSGANESQVAGHLLDVPPAADPWAADVLADAGRSALARGAAEPAARYLGRALAEPPAPGALAAVLALLGEVELRSGRANEAIQHLEEAIERSDAPGALQRRLALALLTLGRPDDGIALLLDAIDQQPGLDDEIALLLEADLAALREMSVTPERRAPRQRLEEVAARLDGGRPAERVLSASLAYARMRECEPASEVAALAERALRSPPTADEEEGAAVIGLAQAMVALICAEALDSAEAIAEDGLTTARARGSVYGIALNTLFLTVASSFRGEVADAHGNARFALDLAREHGLLAEIATATRMLVDSLVELGEHDAAWAELEALGLTGELPELNTFSFLLEGRGRVRVARGEHEEALADLLEAGRRFARWGVDNPAQASWRTPAVVAHLARGEAAEALALADEQLRLAAMFGAPRGLGVALRVRGLAVGGEKGIGILGEAVAVLGDSVGRLEHARALTDLGAALRRANRRSDAQEPLREGLSIARRCGAFALAERAHAELEATGARPRKILRTGVDALTPSERRIAHMAADGMANKEIAQALFVTVRTVETHLSHTYVKLEIDSRGRLAGALGDR